MTMAFVPAEPATQPHRDKGPAFAFLWPGPVRRAEPTIDVVLAHPEPARRDALCRSLALGGRVTVVAVAGTEADASDAVTRLHPAVVVIDDGLPGWQLMARHARIVLLTRETDLRRLGAMLCGPASAYLTYDQFDPADLLDAVHAVGDGLAWLSPTAASAAAAAMRESGRSAVPRRTIPFPPAGQRLTGREREVLTMVCQSMSDAAIAIALTLT
jgi:DNA-binding NarL/FixJ family response regulator